MSSILSLESATEEQTSNSAVMDLLQRRDLWSFIDNELSLRIRADPVGRQATFAVMLTAFQPKPAHLMLSGESSTGKSWLLTNTIEFIPPENTLVLGSSTQRAWFYAGEAIMRPHPVIPGKAVVDYYKVDFRNKVVGLLDNVTPQTIKDLKPVMSHDQPEIEIRAAESQNGGGWRTKRVQVSGCPSFINCTTYLRWDAEISSRHYYLTPADSPEKYEESRELLNQQHTTGVMPTSDKIQLVHNAIRTLRDMRLKVVINPMVIETLRPKFSMVSGRDIRDYERTLTLIESVGWLHALQRERMEGGAVVADQHDWDIVSGFIDELLRTSRSGTNAQVLEYLERVLKPLASDTEQALTVEQIQSKYYEVYNRILHRNIMNLYNNQLLDLGKIELVRDQLDRRHMLVKVLSPQPITPPSPPFFLTQSLPP